MGFGKFFKKAAKKAFKVAAPIAVGIGGATPAGAALLAATTIQRRPGGPLLPPGIGRTQSIRGLPIPRLPPPPPRIPRGGGGGGGGRGFPIPLPLPIPLNGGGAGGCPGGFHPAKDGSGRCVRNRRMNVMNQRAAMRAIRRIKGARKMLMKIERQLPKQRSTRRAPAGHRARLEHR